MSTTSSARDTAAWLSVAIAVLTLVGAFVVPEVRRLLGLSDPVPAHTAPAAALTLTSANAQRVKERTEARMSTEGPRTKAEGRETAPTSPRPSGEDGQPPTQLSNDPREVPGKEVPRPDILEADPREVPGVEVPRRVETASNESAAISAVEVRPQIPHQHVESETRNGARSSATAEGSGVSPVLGVDMTLQRIVNGETIDLHVKYDAKTLSSERSERLMLCCVVSLKDGVISVSRDRLKFKSNDGTAAFSVPYEKLVNLSDQSATSNRVSLHVKVLNTARSREYIKRIQLYNHAAVAKDSKSGPDQIVCDGCDNSLDELYTLLKVLRKNR